MRTEFEKWWCAGLCVDDEAQRKNNEWEEGIALSAWNAALAAVEAKMPDAAFSKRNAEIERSIGWNTCLSIMSERIAALKEGAA